MDSVLAFLKVVFEKSNVLLGSALFGLAVFVLRRSGHLVDLDRQWYFAVIGAGLLAGLTILSGAFLAIVPITSKWIRARMKKKEQAGFAKHSFEMALPDHRAVLLWYKSQNKQRFYARYDQRICYQMAKQGLLENVTLHPGTDMLHYKIPSNVWRLLDDAPDSWAASASRIRIDGEDTSQTSHWAA